MPTRSSRDWPWWSLGFGDIERLERAVRERERERKEKKEEKKRGGRQLEKKEKQRDESGQTKPVF